jgi:hypothetical protein
MKFCVVATACVGALAFVVGCGSAERSPSTDSVGTVGAPAPETSVDVARGSEKNPDGVAYPVADIGYKPRTSSRAGNRIANYKFLGYLNADKTAGLKTISLADYFDPEAKNYKVIHIIASSAWCGACIAETRETAILKDTLLAEKIVFVQALVDGPRTGTGATSGDLDNWIRNHGVNFTAMLDPNVKNLGQFFNVAAVPWNANVDARSMEILSSSEGAPADIAADVRHWTSWVDTNPAKP